MSNIKGLHHVAMKASGQEQYEKAVDFYKNVLGLKIARQWASGVHFDTGCGLIEIFNNAEEDLPQGAVRHFAIGVESTDRLIEVVRGAGCRVTVEPKDTVINAETPYPIRIAFFIGPLGEEIEVFQEK